MRIYKSQQTDFSEAELRHMNSNSTFHELSAAPLPGTIWVKGDARLVVPGANETIIAELLASAHDQNYHVGMSETEHRLSGYYWPGKSETITDHIHSCPICQIMRAPAAPGMLGAPHINNPVRPLHTVIMDYVPMAVSVEGYEGIQWFTDAFTRYSTAIPVRDMSGEAAVAALELYTTHFGMPFVIQTDNSKTYVEGNFTQYMSNTGTEHVVTPSYHAQANAKAERPHKTLYDRLKAALPSGNWKYWSQMLPFIMMTLNTSHNRGINMTPHEALYGRPARSLINAFAGREQTFTSYSIDDYHKVQANLIEHLIAREQARSLMQRDSMASRQGEVAPQFQKGDNVVLWFPTRPAKHYSHWIPGYTVIDSPSADFYYIGKRELDGTIVGFETVPVKRLRLYDARRSPDFGLFMDVKPDHGVVEKVVGHHRNAAGDLAFTVKWAGRAGAAATSTAELQTLMRNCQGMLRSYCKAKSIPWSHLLLQRREHNRAIKAE